MTIGNRVGNWIDRQVSDAKDILSFSYENIRGNNPPSPGRRQFLKGTGAAMLTGATGGAAAGYAAADDINSFLNGDQEQPGNTQNGSNGDTGGEQNEGSNGGSQNGGSDPVEDTDPEVESIYEVLDDAGNNDIQLVEDWLGDGYDRGHNVDDVIMGYDNDADEDYLGFDDDGDVDLPLLLTADNGYSNSEVDTLREYDEEGKLPEVLEPAV